MQVITPLSEEEIIVFNKIKRSLEHALGEPPSKELIEDFIMELTFSGDLRLDVSPDELTKLTENFLKKERV